jgi:hypothetical protein
MDLRAIMSALHRFPRLSSLTFDDVTRFTRLCSLAKPAIQLQQQTLHCAPPVLPTRVVLVLVKAIGQSCHIIEDAWSAFKDIIWNQKGITPTDEEVELFNGSGLSEGLGACAYVLPLQQARSM